MVNNIEEKGKCVILIPAYNPPSEMVDYVRELIDNGFNKIQIINDGSGAEHDKIFHQVRAWKECTVFNHSVNLGKGRALKNGYNIFLDKYKNNSEVNFIIMVDSDGQHTIEDVISVYNKSGEINSSNDKFVVLGTRNFDYDFVPFKSKFGNKLTSRVFRLLYGEKISDTQTGLRAISKKAIPSFIELIGERFEYETNQLIEASHASIPIFQVEIKTVYINNNSETHFNPVSDSFAIYRLLFSSFIKYSLSSVSAALIDLCLFQLLYMLIDKVFPATIISRICSSFYNYIINRNVVFESDSSHKSTFWKYYLLCIIQMCISGAGVTYLSSAFSIKPLLVKMIVDTLLFCISFRIQRKYVFTKETK